MGNPTSCTQRTKHQNTNTSNPIKERETEREKLTIASEEPSTNHLVMSPFWILRELVGDKANWVGRSAICDTIFHDDEYFGRVLEMGLSRFLGFGSRAPNRPLMQRRLAIGYTAEPKVLRSITCLIPIGLKTF